MEAIKKFLKKNDEKKVNIAVVGDYMIDSYYYVQSDRVSPEFPIPVLLSTNNGEPTLEVPGGAGNVCVQFENFNASVNLFGFIDAHGRNVLNPGYTSHCVDLPDGINIPVKRRIYQGEFPLCRWDVEKPSYGWGSDQAGKISLERHQRMLFDNFLKSPAHDAIILSDYNKGVFAMDGKRRWVKDDMPTIIDPKRGPLDHWEGCYIFKPNNKEAVELSGGITQWKDQCKYFNNILRCKAVIITQGGNGVVGTIDGRPFEYRPKKKSMVESVIGAGDCFIAFLALGIAHGMDIEEVVATAFEAGAIYVQKKHNTPVHPNELLASIDPIQAKMSMPEPKEKRKYKLIMTNGVFDCGLTAAHVRYLEYARSMGDKLVVAVNDDDSVKRLKGSGRPILPLEQRMNILAGLSSVDYVVSFSDDTPIKLITDINPDLLIKGGDYKPEQVAGYGIVEVMIVNKFDTISTTEKINLMNSVARSN